MNVIECSNLTKAYGRYKLLDSLSFTIKENTITGLIGRNGAGKTTLLKIIAGYWHYTSGDIRVFSKKPFNNLFVSANTLFIDNQMSLPSSLSLREILETAGSFYENWDSDLAERLFNYFSFHPNQYHNHLSKGSKSTFNMIFGLCARAPLTIFDEPTTGMDAAVRKDFYRALLKDYISHPRTIIISSHHLDEIEDLLENILLLNKGKMLLHIPAQELKEWAISLKGKKSVIETFIHKMEILHSLESGINELEVVVKNTLTAEDIQELKLSGIDVSSVSSGDTAMYLTRSRKGGIDHVFNPS